MSYELLIFLLVVILQTTTVLLPPLKILHTYTICCLRSELYFFFFLFFLWYCYLCSECSEDILDVLLDRDDTRRLTFPMPCPDRNQNIATTMHACSPTTKTPSCEHATCVCYQARGCSWPPDAANCSCCNCPVNSTPCGPNAIAACHLHTNMLLILRQ